MRILNELLLTTQTPVALSQASSIQDLSHIGLWDLTASVTDLTPSSKAFTSASVTVAADTITIASHGFTTGLLVTLTTTGTLPTGLATSTNYYVIVVDANTIKLATSQANALAGTAIDITGAGTGSSNVVPTASLAGSIKIQKTNDPDTTVSPVWFDVTSSSQSFSGATTLNWSGTDVGYRALRALVTVTSGTAGVSLRVNGKGV